MIKDKQVQGLEELRNNAFVSVEQGVNGTVTFTKNDGLSLSFAAGDGTVGEKGDKGPKGDKGIDGLSAYELAVLQGYKGTEESWRLSFKGDKGEPGIDGINGTDGINGNTINFNEQVMVLKRELPVSMIDHNNTLSIGLPDTKEGEIGPSGQKYQIIGGVITESDNVFSVDTTWNGYDGTINVTLPVGKQGNKGAPGITANKDSPTLEEVKVGTILVPGAAWKCTGGGRKDQNGYSFDLAPAADGLQGSSGSEGLPGAVIGNLDITDEDPTKGYACFKITENGISVKFQLDDDSHSIMNFDINNHDITFHNENYNFKENEL